MEDCYNDDYHYYVYTRFRKEKEENEAKNPLFIDSIPFNYITTTKKRGRSKKNILSFKACLLTT